MGRNGLAPAAFLVTALLMSAGCGGDRGKTNPASDPTSDARNGDQGDKGQNQWASLQEEIQAMKPVDPVHFEKLLPLLPDAPAGFVAEEPRGETVELNEHKHSQAERTYRKGDTVLTVRIHDAAQISTLYLAVAVGSQFKRESSDGYEKGTTINGNPGFETYRKANRRSELTILVAKRHLVMLQADGAEPELIRKTYASIDIKKLAGLK